MISFIARGREIIKVKLTKDLSSNWPYGLERKVLMFSFVFQNRCAGSLTFGFRDTVISPLVITTAFIGLFFLLKQRRLTSLLTWLPLGVSEPMSV